MPCHRYTRFAVLALLSTVQLTLGGCVKCAAEEPQTGNVALRQSAGGSEPGTTRESSSGDLAGDKLSGDGGDGPGKGDAGELAGKPESSSLARDTVAAVELDIANRYPAAVMVTVNTAMQEEGAVACSGVLIGPRLVLTAAHCACLQRKAAPEARKYSAVDGSACMPDATVTAVSYEPAAHGEDLAYVNKEYRGKVRPHPEFQMQLDDQGRVVSSHADLALVLLDKPVKKVAPPELSDADVVEGEPIVLVGYIPDDTLGGVDRKRQSSKTKALGIARPGDGGFRVERSMLTLGQGNNGGPCLRETRQGAVLAGILSGSVGEEASCISVQAYRTWLIDELQRAAKTGAPQLAPSP